LKIRKKFHNQMTSRFFLLLGLLATPLSAQDGEQLFTMYCSACHAADGKGATGGAFPPLAKSEWIMGDGERAINVVLHGLEGRISVLGKTYNLAMQPHAAMLPDDQIAAILTYVRKSWGNAESAITPDQVKATRSAMASRTAPWTSEELLKLHPLPLETTALKNLISTVYSGAWTEMPDYSTLTPDSTEEEHLGIIDLDQAAKTDGFGIVWTADFEAPAGGQYMFLLDADDAARLTVAGKVIAKIDGIGPMGANRSKKGKIKLSKGPNPIRIEYFEKDGEQGITLGWKGPKMKDWKWLSTSKGKTGPDWSPIPVRPAENRTAVYRNFIAGTTPRAIGFGFPGGVNLAYSADNLAPELIWTGEFMDAGRHWTERGQGDEPPAGTRIVNLSKNRALPKEARFRGYKLDTMGNPTFAVQIGGVRLLDSWTPSSNSLIRKLSLTGTGAPISIVISDLFGGSPDAAGEIPLGTEVFLKAQGIQPTSQDEKTTLTLAPGESTILTYRWK
jgi:mono/diheme cytochrome c family protein